MLSMGDQNNRRPRRVILVQNWDTIVTIVHSNYCDYCDYCDYCALFTAGLNYCEE